jgi:hypothetical protein
MIADFGSSTSGHVPNALSTKTGDVNNSAPVCLPVLTAIE